MIVSFSSPYIVMYSAYSVLGLNKRHYYANRRLTRSNMIVNTSFIILFSGLFVIEFACADRYTGECVIGYELNVE